VPVRSVAKDVVYEGMTMKAGERVLMYDPAADMDPKQFKNPESYDLKREEKTHIAFGRRSASLPRIASLPGSSCRSSPSK